MQDPAATTLTTSLDVWKFEGVGADPAWTLEGPGALPDTGHVFDQAFLLYTSEH